MTVQDSNFVDYECSLAVGFSDVSTESTDGATGASSNSTGIFYCRSAPVYKDQDESKKLKV